MKTQMQILTKSLLGRCLGGCQFKLVVLSDTQMTIMTMQLILSNATPRQQWADLADDNFAMQQVVKELELGEEETVEKLRCWCYTGCKYKLYLMYLN